MKIALNFYLIGMTINKGWLVLRKNPIGGTRVTIVSQPIFHRLVFAKCKRHQGNLISRLKSRVGSTMKNSRKMAQVN